MRSYLPAKETACVCMKMRPVQATPISKTRQTLLSRVQREILDLRPLLGKFCRVMYLIGALYFTASRLTVGTTWLGPGIFLAMFISERFCLSLGQLHFARCVLRVCFQPGQTQRRVSKSDPASSSSTKIERTVLTWLSPFVRLRSPYDDKRPSS